MVENALRFAVLKEPPRVGDTLRAVMMGGANHEVEVRVDEVVEQLRVALTTAVGEPSRHIFVPY